MRSACLTAETNSGESPARPESQRGQTGRARTSMRTVSLSPLTYGVSGNSRQASGRILRGQGSLQLSSGTGFPSCARPEGESAIHIFAAGLS